MVEHALAGVRVVEFARGIAGAYTGKLLADYGADVVKVEPPEGDPVRRLGPFPDDLPDAEQAGLFLFLNTNKRSLSLDISVASGQVLLRRLLADADVLIEDLPADDLDSRGLGPVRLLEDYSRLVYVSITPFGRTGPYAGWVGNSLTALALGGLMYVTGDPDREPLATGGEAAEFQAGLQGWIGALAALAHRDLTGLGQHVDVSMADSMAASDEYNTALYASAGAIRRRYYSQHTFGYPNEIYPASDGYFVAVPGAAGFPDLMAILIDNPELADHELFKDARERFLRPREFDDLVLPAFRQRTALETTSRAQELRLPFALAPSPPQLLESDHLRARAFFQEVDHPRAGRLRLPGAPFLLSETPARAGRAPLHDEHGPEVLAALGYEGHDLTVLRERGVT
jgi:crotonobetainyl-CoA:carnitine CoA-transferase CaiB-like acyl-CoA transferase